MQVGDEIKISEQEFRNKGGDETPPEDVNCNICQNTGKPATFHTAESQSYTF
jgi:hypothetical protein